MFFKVVRYGDVKQFNSPDFGFDDYTENDINNFLNDIGIYNMKYKNLLEILCYLSEDFNNLINS